ncbi:MAG TPA: hypothetical protein ENK18_06005 [Deltaproteobacteria bacterium]|nr:hypothetical protein [Deltaproteobacteria bacterium]
MHTYAIVELASPLSAEGLAALGQAIEQLRRSRSRRRGRIPDEVSALLSTARDRGPGRRAGGAAEQRGGQQR